MGRGLPTARIVRRSAARAGGGAARPAAARRAALLYFRARFEPLPSRSPFMTEFATDHISGSSDVALAFLKDLERWTAIDTSTTAPGLRATLLRFLRGAQDAQPSLALVHQLAARALQVADSGVTRGDAPAEL